MKAPKTILLIEDDKDDQEFFIQVLSEIESGSLYSVADNGKIAIERLENSVILPDLIVMDINMPVMNGFECLQEITRNPRTGNIPVIFLTSETGRVDFALRLGAKACIQKPSDSTTLRTQIEHMISYDFIFDRQEVRNTFQTMLSGI